ncbi:phospholipid/glycerol acyltransferase [Novosphingobium aromaticivorans DSM 12444]|uniref:Phospholipid/glycerol acyltransferase n=1 Tax=Novosphingobium aromaticivorans (strain ATCC 700278 / DSM 12444 / CCUG 56034 / CIP 105152 / NBRC 16084 / F199) TaxID=279238 RepID=Q2GAW5_NOVAD|nr:lysophospholipid acyltransferase family protein [Novosphingobium aromaticivorans]ABD25008.1 phospholipid/glycerol acyltransferase [Novosphingobium aromaticivorans DSM 12444]SCY86786.1 1-acyl-sn-glycerol-3-phosphate acyltransferases [Novosphingobium aromaticivorans]
MAGAIEDRRPSLLSQAVRKALVLFYRMRGWKAVGTPPEDGRCIIIAAPHTSNWDFLYFIGLTEDLGLRPHFMAKDSLFRWPLGGFMRDMGGVAIDRSARRNVVDAMVAEFARRDRFMLTIAPEGTRGKVGEWRTGFYQIALRAKVPMYVGLMDYGTKTGGLGPAIWPTGDYDADMARIFEVYRSVTPKHPERGLTKLPEKADG